MAKMRGIQLLVAYFYFCFCSFSNLVSCCGPKDISTRPWPGCYTICTSLISGNSYRYFIYPDNKISAEYVIDGPLDISFLIRSVSMHENLEMSKPNDLFDVHGMKLTKIPVNESIMLFSGRRFHWPPIDIGFKRNITLFKKSAYFFTTKLEIELETLSVSPVVFSIKNFLSLDECRYIRNRASSNLLPSTVKNHDNDNAPAEKWRTSKNEFLSTKGDETFKLLDEKISSLVRVPNDHQEKLQLLKYEVGGQYDSHQDYFNKQYYLNNADMLDLIQNGQNNRMATVLWYLNTVEEGGETVFPRFNHAALPTSYKDCSKVVPEEGKVVLFYNLYPNGELNEYSLHGACKVVKGEKWAANKWIWKDPYRDTEIL